MSPPRDQHQFAYTCIYILYIFTSPYLGRIFVPSRPVGYSLILHDGKDTNENILIHFKKMSFFTLIDFKNICLYSIVEIRGKILDFGADPIVDSNFQYPWSGSLVCVSLWHSSQPKTALYKNL